MSHFLADNQSWKYIQPTMGVKLHYVAVGNGKGEKSVQEVSAQHNCRESLIYNMRPCLQRNLCQKVTVGSKDWEFVWKRVWEVDLLDPAAKQEGQNYLYIDRRILTLSHKSDDVTNEMVEKFLLATDAVVGPMCVLLAHSRREGEWWRTTSENRDHDSRPGSNFLRWFGTDNFLLQHPALISIVLGLFRQVALICRAGYADRILESVDRKEVEDCLSSGNWKNALEIVRKTREFIEVPSPAGNGPSNPEDKYFSFNFPFPLGYWKRMHRLQIGARRHGYEKLLDQDFSTGWNLGQKGSEWSGAYALWGKDGDAREAQRRLMELGKPRSKKRDQSASIKA